MKVIRIYNTDEFIDRAMEIACVKYHKKILQIRTQEVEQYALGCQEIVLTSGNDEIINNGSQYLLKANLFSKAGEVIRYVPGGIC